MREPINAFADALRRRDGRAARDIAFAIARARLPQFDIRAVESVLRTARMRSDGPHDAPPAMGGTMRVLSWNLLRRVGARPGELAALIERSRIDIALLQEATAEFEALPSLVGGTLVRHALPGRIHGPAIWARRGLAQPRRVPLFSHAVRRHAVIAEIGGASFASVHLSHGQWMCRRQAREVGDALGHAPAVIAGDFNMVGPLRLAGFDEVGPREATHYANGVLPLCLDRCFVRGFARAAAWTLSRGNSDHRPILLDLAPLAQIQDDTARGVVAA
jgi:endonuclease/exonuclease/phosphatase family metal-dependent hydrolase